MLSFIPPDGGFQLLDYQTVVPLNQKPPLHVKADMSLDEYGGECNFPCASASVAFCWGPLSYMPHRVLIIQASSP